MGFELTLAVLVVVFRGFGVGRSAGMEALRRQIRALQLLSEGSGSRPDVQKSTADTLLESESNSGLLWPTSEARSGCINKDFLPQQFLTDLVSGEPLNDGHRATAVRTNP
jgi:hypothetical protein